MVMNTNFDDAMKEKRKINAHCVNLECQKQQLLILLEKLYNISSNRIQYMPGAQNLLTKYMESAGSYLFSIGDQIKQAQKSRKHIDKEISEAKSRLEAIEVVIKKRKQV
jgi:hypothetical protein